MLPWQQLPFLEEESSAFPVPFKEELNRDEVDAPDAEGAGPADTQEGVEVLTRKCVEVEKRVQTMRYRLESKSEHITYMCVHVCVHVCVYVYVCVFACRYWPKS